MAPRLLSGPFLLEAPGGPGSRGAPEGPAAPEGLDTPSLLWRENTDRWSSPDRRTALCGRPREQEEPSGSAGNTRASSRKSAASCRPAHRKSRPLHVTLTPPPDAPTVGVVRQMLCIFYNFLIETLYPRRRRETCDFTRSRQQQASEGLALSLKLSRGVHVRDTRTDHSKCVKPARLASVSRRTAQGSSCVAANGSGAASRRGLSSHGRSEIKHLWGGSLSHYQQPLL